MSGQEDASFTNSKYTMHTPTGENEYISVNVSLFVIYIMYKYPLFPLKPRPQSLLGGEGVIPKFNFTILIVFSFKSSTQFPASAIRRYKLCRLKLLDFCERLQS